MGVLMLGLVPKVFDLKAVRSIKSIYYSQSCTLFGGHLPNCIIRCNMTSSSQLCPPSDVRGMKQLKKELFDKKISVPCLILPVSSIVQTKPALKSYFLKMQNFRPLQELPIKGDSHYQGKLVFSDDFSFVLNPSKIAVLDPDKITNFDDISDDHRLILSEYGVNCNNFINVELKIGYDQWKANEILRAIIPDEFESVSSYSICGHVLHLNLREQLNEYKEIIGKVLLEKVVNARTVVNKTDNIDSTYRTFSMEILSGDDDLVVTMQENRCKFMFDFSKVYWNSRLSTEHERIVSYINKGDVLYDVFCGVGPFAIPASKKGCRVLANDLNPESIKWLKESAKINKVDFQIYCKDGNNFIKEDFRKDILEIDPVDFKGNIHIVMNLPALAVDFLPTFRGLFSSEEMERISQLQSIKVYVYCFTKGEEDPIDAAKHLVESKIGSDIADELIDVHFVRNVAPMKEMMRVSFPLSARIILSGKRPNDLVDNRTVSLKKICLEQSS